MTMGNDPYKMPARLAVLSHMTGSTPLWNCKSGKDRTGELDAEAKFLAAQIALTGDVPEPDAKLSEEDTRMFREFALNTGNLEIQQMNTGLAGFKTEGVGAITERIGDAEAREFHRGASPFVKG
jgi:phosphatidylinositol-4,5-bisphosphate 4-phosphatase